MTDFFKPDDFFIGDTTRKDLHEWIAGQANAKLKAHIESLPEVYEKRYPYNGDPYSVIWATYENEESAMGYKNLGQRARLWGIEEIKPKVCEHKEFVNYEFRSDKGIICTCICGAKLSPNHWKEVE